MASSSHNGSAATALPRACVIGAGSSGIAVVKALRDRGVPFDCFERSDQVGGNWVFGNRNGMSAAYRDLFINVSRERMAYADYPMPSSYPDFPHHTHIKEYFDNYVDHFGLREEIEFETSVEHVDRREDGVWEVTIERVDGGGHETREYNAVIVANGHHWDPRWPEPAFPGQDEFKGTQLHAHSYVDNSIFAGKDVAIVGMGNSAMDIAVESSYVAANTYLSARKGAWIIPKYVFGKPVDQLPNNPRVPFAIRQRMIHQTIKTITGPPERYGLPKPDHKFGESHPTVSGRILDRIAHGTIAPKPNIASLSAESVRFTDGSEAHVDVVVYCTGYKISFPFFDEGFLAAPDNHIELFRRVFHPDIHGLFFVGLLQPLGAIMPLAEAQGAWVGDYLRGEYALPSPAQVRKDVARDQEAMKRRYVASKRHTIQVDFDDYLYALAAERKAGAERARAQGYSPPLIQRRRVGALVSAES
ncbi:MAG TPA: NAD(P)-binding domain-containing protein [Solirubrobacteraceae bacterium]|nr:NAD(P)-binding domain-containing protein [Solirubrobacteraceae bacterium]